MYFIHNLRNVDVSQMTKSASSAKVKRSRTEAKSAEEERKEYERLRVEKEQNIGRLWMKIHELQERERELEKK